MIRVRAERGREGFLFVIEAKGHANYAKQGQDVVCAAVTAIVAACANALTDLLHVDVAYHMEAGDVGFRLKEVDARTKDVRLLTESCLLGLRQIAAGYPANLCVREVPRERRDGGAPLA